MCPAVAQNVSSFTKAGHPTTLAKQAQKNNMQQSPSKLNLQGRTLVQLQQARSQPSLAPPDLSSDFDSDASETVAAAMGGPKLLPSPAKWDPIEMGDEMPSPFLAKKGGTRGVVR